MIGLDLMALRKDRYANDPRPLSPRGLALLRLHLAATTPAQRRSLLARIRRRLWPRK